MWGTEDDSDCVTETLPSLLSETLTELQIRFGIEDDSEIFFLIPPCKFTCILWPLNKTISARRF